MDFSSFSFDQRILTGIRDCGYVSPTPIQLQAMPAVLNGQDVLGLAQTGTGKTAAFALPLLQRLLDADAPKRGPVQILILAPTRELALQIHDAFVAMGKQTGIRCAVVFGGVGETPQIRAASQASVLVACPGRLLDLARRKLIDLSRVRALVLDEADHMFDMGFVPDVRRILAMLPSTRQNLLFSATMPTEIRAIADQLLVRPTVVQVANNAPAETITHSVYPVCGGQKLALLEMLLKTSEHDCVLIFTRTKHRAKSLARKLEQKGWLATSLQGNLSQNRRQEALDGFRQGRYQIMVATDIAARGIDCTRVTHVVNFDVPDTAENYTHRIGRTGRAERSGQAVTLVAREDAVQIRLIERVLGMTLERKHVEGFPYQEERGDGDAAFEEPRAPRAPRRGAASGQPRRSKSERPVTKGDTAVPTASGRPARSRPARNSSSVFGMSR